MKPNSLRLPIAASVRCGAGNVEGDFGRMHFEGELDAALLEFIEDRIPHAGEERVAVVDHLPGDRRERVEQVPDRDCR